MGTTLGSSSPASKVGYSVRFDNNVSPNTKIKFLTEGMLLQEMLRDPNLTQYSAVIVDEVHERGVNVDLILGFLRNIVTGDKKGRKGAPLKTVVMSATADTEALFNFFEEGFSGKQTAPSIATQAVKKPLAPVEATETESSWSGISSSENEVPASTVVSAVQPKTNGTLEHSQKPPRKTPPGWVSGKGKKDKDKVKELLPVTSANISKPPVASVSRPDSEPKPVVVSSEYISACFIKGRQHPVEVLYIPEAAQDFADTALKTVFQIHHKEPLPGDILVFLTGQETIEYALKLVKELALAMGPEIPKAGFAKEFQRFVN